MKLPSLSCWLLAVSLACGPALTPLAATITVGTNAPPVGDGVQNLLGASASANNAQLQYANSDYLAGDNNGSLGQTFTTGPNPAGYYLTAISFQQVPYNTWWWTGGTIGFRVFQTTDAPASGVQQMTVLAADSGTVPAVVTGVQHATPGSNAYWITLAMTQESTLLLQPNTQYGFDIQATGTGSAGPFFMEWNGTNANVYSGGQAIMDGTPTAPAAATVWQGRGATDGDRVFVAAMTALSPPWLQLNAGSQNFSLTLGANPGKWYWLQYADSLQSPHWQDALPNPVYATNSLLTIAGLNTSANQQFYRLQEVNSAFGAFIRSNGLASLKYVNNSSGMAGSGTESTDGPDFIAAGSQLGNVTLKYQPAGNTNWFAVNTTTMSGVASSAHQVAVSAKGTSHVFHYEITNGLSGKIIFESVFLLGQGDIAWTLNVTNLSSQTVTIGDLALPLPMNTTYSTPSTCVLKHSFISGNGSWIFWMRPDSVGPYLTLTPADNTKLEYWDRLATGNIYEAYIHSAVAAATAAGLGSEWRQPNTSLTLAVGGSQTYGFKFRWADDYNGVRQVLVDEGKIDVRVVPGMTVPTNLIAKIALRTTQVINSVQAEFPAATQIQSLGNSGAFQLYQVQFSKLGENKLTINYGNNRQMVLEFFVTEPLETLINKRAQFLVNKQINNTNKWYDGLYPEWNMASQTLVTPDNYDLLPSSVRYEVASDDAGLSRPAFLALKNAVRPVQAEVASLDKYINKFVWGGLQRTTNETYAYGVYGINDWYSNRNSSNTGYTGQLHLWRTYDYPHIITMYESMYRVAKYHPEMATSHSAQEYLRRAYGTAIALFTVPLQVWNNSLWIPYNTGYMNESVLPDLLKELAVEGMSTEAADLRSQWEQKVNHFVLSGADLFASEYSFDSTGFESQQAMARYAIENYASLGATNPAAYLQAANEFMNEETAANIFLRGWLETAYYHYGSDYRQRAGDDYTLSYMSQLGGWGLLDYALHFSTNPAPYLQLGYGSYLSSFALMNTGTTNSNYGYWYPGAANDGACGGGFEASPYNITWLGQPARRGAWYYGAEEDLGFCGAIRAAATILADDPVFGRICYGGTWQVSGGTNLVVPLDGVRQRFHAMLNGGMLHAQMTADRFAAGQTLKLNDDLSRLEVIIESSNPVAHNESLQLITSRSGVYSLSNNHGFVTNVTLVAQQSLTLTLPVDANATQQPFILQAVP